MAAPPDELGHSTSAPEAEDDAPCDWASAPREMLLAVFQALPLKDRCKTVGAVCAWWRAVSLEAALLPDLNLNGLPLFSRRERDLPGWVQQRKSFMAWLLTRRASIRRLSLTAERWEDDTQAGLYLRLVVAEVLSPQLEGLRLVCTDSGQATAAFLRRGGELKRLQLDFWGRSHGLPRELGSCTALTQLVVQCSSGMSNGTRALASLKALRDLSVSDCDWPKVPGELLQLPLTRLHLRFADFASTDWWPADAGTLASTLEALELPGCQIGAVPEGLSQLAALTRLSLERNFVRSLPAALSALRRLQDLSCEGCASLQQLPRALAAALPLRSLNLMHSGVLRLPLGAGARVLAGCGGDTGGGSGAEEEEEEEPAPSHFLRHLTELRWGAPEWERGARLRPFAAGWAGPGAASSGPEAGRLPDLSPLAQARGLRRVQLACVPAGTEAQLAELRLLLPELERLQVNSALFWLG